MAYKNGDLEEALALLKDLRDQHPDFAETKNVSKVIDQIEKKLK